MVELKIEIPGDLKNEIRKHSDIVWSKVFEKAVREELGERAKRHIILSALNKLLENSKLTEQDAIELGRKVNEGMYKRLKKEGLS